MEAEINYVLRCLNLCAPKNEENKKMLMETTIDKNILRKCIRHLAYWDVDNFLNHSPIRYHTLLRLSRFLQKFNEELDLTEICEEVYLHCVAIALAVLQAHTDPNSNFGLLNVRFPDTGNEKADESEEESNKIFTVADATYQCLDILRERLSASWDWADVVIDAVENAPIPPDKLASQDGFMRYKIEAMLVEQVSTLLRTNINNDAVHHLLFLCDSCISFPKLIVDLIKCLQDSVIPLQDQGPASTRTWRGDVMQHVSQVIHKKQSDLDTKVQVEFYNLQARSSRNNDTEMKHKIPDPYSMLNCKLQGTAVPGNRSAK